MDFEVAGQTLLELKEILDRLKVKFYLSDGTMLGAMRNKNFIPGDDDIELRTAAREWDFSIFKDFKRRDFQCTKIARPHLYQDKASGASLSKRGIKIGIGLNYYYPPGDLAIYLSGRPLDHATVQLAKFYRGDHFVDFLDAKFRVPYPPEEYLEALYDKDWRIPMTRKAWRATLKPISIAKYAKYFTEHPEINRARG